VTESGIVPECAVPSVLACKSLRELLSLRSLPSLRELPSARELLSLRELPSARELLSQPVHPDPVMAAFLGAMARLGLRRVPHPQTSARMMPAAQASPDSITPERTKL
jgi:hypothetical protein